MNCAECKKEPKNKCAKEGFDCTGGSLELGEYTLAENIPLQNTSDLLRREHGNSLCRTEEIINYCQKLGIKKVGLVFCIGLAEEARLIAKIFKQHFRVASVCCRMTGIDKDKNQHLVKINEGEFETSCNPIGQAKMLNKLKTEINVQLGLCVGHDMLFHKYSDAPVTVLAVKDRVLANNPLGIVYSSYMRKKFNIDS
ncbi:MAG: DUF1847 domain-containing protein [Nitrospirota bacterium]